MTCNVQVTGGGWCYTAGVPTVTRKPPGRRRRDASPTPPAREKRSRCPVACTLDLIGDRWSLLVIRDLILGKHRYAEFADSPEGIPTNVLAERLKRLVASGIVKATRYSAHPPRVEYALTPKGEELRPIVRAMSDWGVKHAGGRLPAAILARRAVEAQDEQRTQE